MSWPNWPHQTSGVMPTSVAPGMQYNPEQWAQMQQQNWQQWAQWQQQYQQWHQQYGAEYQKSMSALATPAVPPMETMPNMGVPPPLPVESKPPLPPEEPPNPMPSFNSMPPKPTTNYSTLPPSNLHISQDDTNKGNQFPSNYKNTSNNWYQNKRPLTQGNEYENSKRQMTEKPPDWTSIPPPSRGPGNNFQNPPPNISSSGSAPAVVKSGANIEELSEAEKKFDKEFAAWEQQFNKWKEQNASHPDKEQYKEYEKKWESWRNSLLERREQMRRKRLSLANASGATKTVNLQQPPPSQNTLKSHESNRTLLPTPASTEGNFNKPPPNLNNEPLSFQDAETSQDVGEQENKEKGFLNTSSCQGIPGLDLVKEGNEEEEKEFDKEAENVENPVTTSNPSKGADLEALSKGINTILGDEKLLSMLSMVSQTTSTTVAAATINTVAKPQNRALPPLNLPPPVFNSELPQTNNFNDQSNNSFEERSNQGGEYYNQRELVNNFDDQTRSSFTMGPNDQETKMESGSGSLNLFNKNLPRFAGRNENFDQRQRDRYDGNQNNLFGKNNFGRSFPGNKGNENLPFSGLRNTGNQSNFEPPDRRFPPNSRDDFNRDMNFTRNNFNTNRRNFESGRLMPKDNFENFQNNYNRSDFNRGVDSNRGIPDRRPADNIGTIPPLMDFNRRPPDDFNARSRIGSRDLNISPLSNAPQSEFRSLIDNAPQGEIRPFVDNAPQSDIRPLMDNYVRGNQDDFIRRNQDFNEGNFNREIGKGFVDNFHKGNLNNRGSQDNFISGPNFERNLNNRGSQDNFNSGPNFERNLSGECDFPFQNQSEDNDYNEDNWCEADDFDKYHAKFSEDEPVAANVVEQEDDFIPERLPSEDDGIFEPVDIVDYNHKSLKPPEPEVCIEPIYMFDYRHKSLARIPIPQRPKWLSYELRNIREFDPLASRSFERRYEPFGIRPRRELERRGTDKYRDNSTWNTRSTSRERFDEHPRERMQDDRFVPESKYLNRNSSRVGDNKRSELFRKDDKKIDFEELSDDEMDWNNDSDNNSELHKQAKVTKNSNIPSTSSSSSTTMIEDLINPPGRFNRPPRIVIILRGPPGSGKTFLAKLIKDKEVESGGSAPRILSLDDYFMVEQEKTVIEDDKIVKVKEMVYEYEAEMEESYRSSLIKSFKKTITDGYFPFIIVDNINDKVKYFGEMWSFAKQNGFQVYICQLELDVQLCSKRNTHGRTEKEIQACVAGWESTPNHHTIVDATAFLQSGCIPDVEMEEVNSPPSDNENVDEGAEDEVRSKWDNFDCSSNNLARLDGVSKPLRPSHQSMEEYLQLDDEWESTKPSKPGQKRVRWADLEEQKQQAKMRAIGFVVGQTNWDRLMDPTSGGSALTQTKYIERVKRF